MSFNPRDFASSFPNAGTLVLVDLNNPTAERRFPIKPPPATPDPSHAAPISTSTPLCERCRIALEYYAYYIDLTETKGQTENLPPSAITLHQNQTEFLHSLSLGCHLGDLLFQSLYRYKDLGHRVLEETAIEMVWHRTPGSDDVADGEEGPGQARQLQFALVKTNEPRSTDGYWVFQRLRLWDSAKYEAFHRGPDTDSVTTLFDKLEVRQESSLQSRAERILDYIYPVPEGSEEHQTTESSRDLAVRWLNRCRANKDGSHDQCNQVTGGYMPTRLLDVEGAIKTQSLKLVSRPSFSESSVSGNSDEFITLSHCWGEWGTTGLPSLTTKNISERETTGISMDLLPKTFHDAVLVCSWFNVKWLWIDSFCIIQDSREDWQKEAAQMCNVYKHALLNISADGSRDARGGCFQPRQPSMTTPLHVQLPAAGKAFVIAADEPDVFRSITASPIAERCWVFQERQLSRRVLHFADTQLEWECCAAGNSFASETYPNGFPFFRSDFSGQPKVQSRGSLGDMPLREVHESWVGLCEQYSTKSLSHIKDKLVALSGLAKEFSDVLHGDRYIAGAWESTLPHSLLWKATGGSGTRVGGDIYVGPSWSWVSIDGPVNEMQPGQGDRTSIVEILESSVDLEVPTAPTGAITGASLKVRGFLRKVTIRPDYEEKPWHYMAVGGMIMHQLDIHGSRRTITAGMPMNGQDPYADEDPRENDFLHSADFHYSFDEASILEGNVPEVTYFFLPIDVRDGIDPMSGTASGLLLLPAVEGDAQEMTTVFRRVGWLEVSAEYMLPMRYRRDEVQGGDEAVAVVDGKSEEEEWEKMREGLVKGYDRKNRRLRVPDRISVYEESRPVSESDNALEAWYSMDAEIDPSLGFAKAEVVELTIV